MSDQDDELEKLLRSAPTAAAGERRSPGQQIADDAGELVEMIGRWVAQKQRAGRTPRAMALGLAYGMGGGGACFVMSSLPPNKRETGAEQLVAAMGEEMRAAMTDLTSASARRVLQ